MAFELASRSWNSFFRKLIIFAVDASIFSVALILAVHLRVGEAERAQEILDGAPLAVPLFTLVALATFAILRMHRRIWRYTSVGDLFALAQAVTLSIIAFNVLLNAVDERAWLPRSIPMIHWFVLMVMLGGARILRRIVGDYLSGSVAPPKAVVLPDRTRNALIAGPCDQAEQLLRDLESQREAVFCPVGLIVELGLHREARVRGVPILGSYSELSEAVERLRAAGKRPECLVFADNVERLRGAAMVGMVAEAQRLGLEVAYREGISDFKRQGQAVLDFRYMNLADLLGRPQARLDTAVVKDAIVGRRVLITGAGGTIGRELARQIAGYNPAQLLMLDANEFNLYEADLELGENHPEVPRVPILCSIRQRQQLMGVFAKHRPELVFHAGALKHVPLVEANIAPGVQTNVLGTRNVADAALRYGARAMIQVSTDKAVNPVGFMGVTKRLGELYCQALDLENRGDPDSPRFMTVRFGNVLGSSGSLIPLFQRQLSHGGPLTVTHPEIERFFMTVHEAVQLILNSASRGIRDNLCRGRIFVLDMGEPVRIMDIARRMIRLAGLRPEIDIPIEVVGLRPGEKLYEELFDSREDRKPSSLPGVFEAQPDPVPLARLNRLFDQLELASAEGDDATCEALARSFLEGPPDFEAALILGEGDLPRQRAQMPFMVVRS